MILILCRCLEKNFENRPFMVEILEHPFFTELAGASGNDHHVCTHVIFATIYVIIIINKIT